MKKHLFIEGSENAREGLSLRKGFYTLLEKALGPSKVPQIIMGGSKKETIRRFRRLGSGSALLIDLDKPENNKNEDLTEHNLSDLEHKVFFMIQEMEAWFISQKSMIDNYFGAPVSNYISNKPPMEIADPKSELDSAMKTSIGHKYKEITHGAELLSQLDPKILQENFPDFKNLLTKLSE